LKKISPVVVYGEDLVGPAAIKEARSWVVRGIIAVVDEYDERIFSLDTQARALKEAMKGREARKLEVHMERMLEQRDNPDGTQSPGIIGVVAEKPSKDHRVRLRMAKGGFSGPLHVTDLRRPDVEEKEAFESAVRRHEAELRRMEAQRIALAYERSKQTWRSVVDEDRERRIAEARAPHDLKRSHLFELAQQALEDDDDQPEEDAGERLAPGWSAQAPMAELAVTPPDRPARRLGL
jgi:hypothetical protein